MKEDVSIFRKEVFCIDNYCLFPEIKTEYDYYNASYGDKKYRLLYRVRQYIRVPDSKVDNYRNLNISLKHYRRYVGDEVVVAYYKTYAIKVFSLDFKKRYIELLLKRHYDDISHKVENVNYNKNKSDSLSDEESRFVESLTNYYLGGYETEQMLTPSMERRHRDKEVIALSGCYNLDTRANITESYSINRGNDKWRINKMTKERSDTVNRTMNKSWKNSFTRKMGLLWSYIPNRDTEFYRKKIREFNPNTKYYSEWLAVTKSNTFNLDDKLYLLDTNIERQYRVDSTGYYPMDKILVISQKGKTKFYDMNGDEIHKESISLIN